MVRIFRSTIILFILLMLVLPASCSGKEIIANKKISSLLLTQMNLKKERFYSHEFRNRLDFKYMVNSARMGQISQ